MSLGGSTLDVLRLTSWAPAHLLQGPPPATLAASAQAPAEGPESLEQPARRLATRSLVSTCPQVGDGADCGWHELRVRTPRPPSGLEGAQDPVLLRVFPLGNRLRKAWRPQAGPDLRRWRPRWTPWLQLRETS